ncbi:hypothetical protein I548_3572 [Mycobacterium intracellulare]|nr:hypothetical protein I548_3572 [Mycobacterium intracellulare]
MSPEYRCGHRLVYAVVGMAAVPNNGRRGPPRRQAGSYLMASPVGGGKFLPFLRSLVRRVRAGSATDGC